MTSTWRASTCLAHAAASVGSASVDDSKLAIARRTSPTDPPFINARPSISRFHAVYWIGLLLAAGEPLPTRIAIHEYLQTEGRKISKSDADRRVTGGSRPNELLHTYGRDALRWWLLSDVTPVGDTDFTEERLVTRYTEDLANTIGNLVNRTVTLARRAPDHRPPPLPADRADAPELDRATGLADKLGTSP